MRSILLATLALSALAVAFAPSASAQAPDPATFESCGSNDELVLVFMNPDLGKRDDGYVHASGRFFIQFQARGPKALEIEKMYFSFGKPAADQNICDTPAGIVYTDGVFLQNYRADFDWQDGFFVPINTYNVPDGEYIASISTYDATGKEMVRYWTRALVENGCQQPPCERPEYVANDKIVPWPIVLPGDGVRTDGKDGLYIEVAEPVAEIKAWLGTHEGQKIVELTNTTPPMRDDDVAPDVPNNPLGPTTLDCAGAPVPAQCAKQWGSAWEWPGVIGDEAVIRVRIVDMNGNVAEKVVHVGDPTIGGRVSAGTPELNFVLDTVDKTTDKDGRAVWNVTYQSVNDDGVHGNIFIRNADGTPLDANFRARPTPNHVMMGGKEQREGTVEIVAGPDVAPGAYEFRLVVKYLAAAGEVEKETPLKLQVVDRFQGDIDSEEEIASEAGEEVESTRGEDLSLNNASVVVPEETPKDTPGPAAFAVLAGAAVAVALRKRKA